MTPYQCGHNSFNVLQINGSQKMDRDDKCHTQGSVLYPVLFNIFINNLIGWVRVENTTMKSVNDIEMGRDSKYYIELEEKWTKKNQMYEQIVMGDPHWVTIYAKVSEQITT